MYALGTFAGDDERPFPGSRARRGAVVDLSGYGWHDINQILHGWLHGDA